MTTASEYRKFADECLRWATEAETEEFKTAFLQMARDWTLAAMRVEGVLAPKQQDLAPKQQDNERPTAC